MSAARATASATPPRMASALWLYVPIAVLVGLGVVMVASATLHAGDAEPSMTLFTRHVQFLTAAIGLGILAWVVPVSAWRFAAPYLFLGALALLAIVLVPGVGRTANGATRWIPLIAGINLQPSEWMKLASIVFLAAYLDNRHDELGQPVRGFWMPLVLLAVAAGLLLLEPDFGTLFVVVATGLGLLFLAGMPLAQFTGMLLAFAVAAAAAGMEPGQSIAFLDGPIESRGGTRLRSVNFWRQALPLAGLEFTCWRPGCRWVDPLRNRSGLAGRILDALLLPRLPWLANLGVVVARRTEGAGTVGRSQTIDEEQSQQHLHEACARELRPGMDGAGDTHSGS